MEDKVRIRKSICDDDQRIKCEIVLVANIYIKYNIKLYVWSRVNYDEFYDCKKGRRCY